MMKSDLEAVIAAMEINVFNFINVVKNQTLNAYKKKIVHMHL